MKSKFDDIENDEDLQKVDVLYFNETRLDESDCLNDNLCFGNKTIICRCDRNSNGGLALNKQYKGKDLNLVHSNLEVVGMQIYVPYPLNIVNVYRPPGCNKNKFVSNLCEVLNDISVCANMYNWGF